MACCSRTAEPDVLLILTPTAAANHERLRHDYSVSHIYPGACDVEKSISALPSLHFHSPLYFPLSHQTTTYDYLVVIGDHSGMFTGPVMRGASTITT